MQDTTAPKLAPAASRTWAARIVDRECGVIVEIADHTVTLTNTAQGITAEVNGHAAPLAQALHILQTADRLTVTAETLLTPAPTTIGKARACRLHRILGRLGLPSAQHYRLASVALGQPVESLAALTEGQARRVWADVLALFPEAAAA